MTDDDRPETPLNRMMRALDLQPAEVIRAAAGIAREWGIRSVSRRQLGRFLSGEGKPTEDKIFVVTSAIQDLSGLPLTAADLFRLERGEGTTAGVLSLPRQVSRAAHGRSLSVPVFSPGGALSRIWRVLVMDDAAVTQADEFEQLYTEYSVLLRAIAIRGYHVPPDDAEELVHDTFMAFLQRHTYIHNAKDWLSATVRNRCMNWQRDHRREVPLTPDDYQTVDETAQGTIESCIRRLSAAAVLAQLGDKCRETLLGFISEESIEHIAERLVITKAYAERLISRCRSTAIAKYRAMRHPRRI